MSTLAHNPWLPRAGSFAVWLLAAGCAVYWGLKLPAASGAAAPAPVPAGPAAPADPAAVARLLGATAAVPGAGPVATPARSSRFALVGVVSGRSQGGAALIAVDGKPAKPYRVGATVEDGLVLQSVAPRRATLGPAANGPAAFTLEMPLPRR
ncbi:MAG: type II secretion system protein N [Ramlibacter sp.]